MKTVNDIYPQVAEIIADVLVIEESDVALDKRLVNDLGAESIDFLDLVFQLEKEFSIKLPRGQLEKDIRGGLTDEEFEQNGVVTEKGLAILKSFLSEVPDSYYPETLKVNALGILFTVETICKQVLRAQAQVSTTAEETTAA